MSKDKVRNYYKEWFGDAPCEFHTLFFPAQIARVQVDDSAKADPRDTASTRLIFETDDKVLERVIEAVNALFFSPPSTTIGGASSKRNLETLFIEMAEAVAKSDRGSMALRTLFQNVFRQTLKDAVQEVHKEVIAEIVQETVAAHMKALDTYYRKSRAVPKGPRK